MNVSNQEPILQTLPGDDIRQIMWRYTGRYDLQMLVQSTRSVSKGIVAHAVANGVRNTHDWTEEKQSLLIQLRHLNILGMRSEIL